MANWQTMSHGRVLVGWAPVNGHRAITPEDQKQQIVKRFGQWYVYTLAWRDTLCLPSNISQVTPVSQHKPMAHAYNGSRPACTSPDLGLPYEVQHYILGMMQRILEEGCYTFASRWIPDVLQRNNWTCSEAVELSTWRTVLPENVPSEAITSHGKSLQQCLANAVRIRNSATHRHIFSSQELRGLAQQAEDLMSLLSDHSRQLKFHKLWTELYDWEKLSVTDMQAARYKMEMALQQIGERPMEDDMDWTPNVISLEKVPAVEIGPEEVENHEVHDEMEID